LCAKDGTEANTPSVNALPSSVVSVNDTGAATATGCVGIQMDFEIYEPGSVVQFVGLKTAQV